MGNETVEQLAPTLRFIGDLLDEQTADYIFQGRFRFRIADDWAVVVSSDFPGRLRLRACHASGRGRTLWCATADRARLKGLVLAARDEALSLTA
jgi:hypothetical protein